MALPTLVKTGATGWQFDVNNRGGEGTSSTQDFAKTMFAIKETMTNFPTLPMVVSRSSNASTASAGDNWTTYDDVNWSSGAHSWIVLKSQGPIPYEICIACDDSAWFQTSWIGFSITGGFNLAAGGTDGTTSARPTALDEVEVHGTNHNWAGGQTAAHSSMVHGLNTKDGDTLMLIVHINGSAVIVWRFDIIQNPVTGYTTGMHMYLRFGTSGSNLLSLSNQAGSGNSWSMDDTVGLNGTVYLSYEAINDTESAALSSFTQPNAWDGNWPFYPVGVWTGGAKRGRVGTLTDIWWGSSGAYEGDSYPNTGTLYQFVVVGNMVIPWDQTNPLKKA